MGYHTRIIRPPYRDDKPSRELYHLDNLGQSMAHLRNRYRIINHLECFEKIGIEYVKRYSLM